MSRLLVAGVVVAAALGPAATAGAQQMPQGDGCRSCHAGLQDPRLAAPALTYGSDIHAHAGFDCLSCHGAVPAGHDGGAMDPALGFIARPSVEQVPALCGSCHSDIQFMKQYDPSMRVDQLAEYWTSGHGVALERGDTAVAVCTSCHPAHQIRSPSDPESSVYSTRVAELCGSCHGDATLMASRGLPTDQLDHYRTSVHGRQMYEEGDVSAPTCNDCHGNHGASPPGVAAVDQVCGQCHSVLADAFAASEHELPFREAGLASCAACHGNHGILPPTDADLATRGEQVCGRCHQSPDTAASAFDIMLALIDSLETDAAAARVILARAEDLGMDVSRAQYELEDVRNTLTTSRSAVHTFSVDSVRAGIDEGLALVERARVLGEERLWEHDYRRIGLAGSAGIILLLVVGLVLKIREIERDPPAPARPASPEPEKPHARV